MKLSATAHYSPLERDVFGLLPNQPGITTTMIAAELYGRKLNGRQIVLGALMGLRKKAMQFREPFRIQKSIRRGPHPIEWWIEKK